MIHDILIVMALFGLYILSVAVNTIFGILQNVQAFKLEFDKEKMKNGTLKSFMLLTGLLMLTIILFYVPTVLNGAGLHYEASESICNLAIYGLIGSAIYKYSKDALEKMKTIFSLTETELKQMKVVDKTTELEEIHIERG